MNIITAGVEQIRESYFEEVVEDYESFPTIHRASLLSVLSLKWLDITTAGVVGWEYATARQTARHDR